MKGFSSDSSSKSEDLQEKTPKNVQAVVTDREVVVYKWLDVYGVMQFSSIPPTPADGIEAEMMVLSPNTNVMDALKIPKEEDKAEQKPNIISLGSPYSPEGMKGMIDDSMQLQEQMTQQQAEQEKMMGELFKK